MPSPDPDSTFYSSSSRSLNGILHTDSEGLTVLQITPKRVIDPTGSPGESANSNMLDVEQFAIRDAVLFRNGTAIEIDGLLVVWPQAESTRRLTLKESVAALQECIEPGPDELSTGLEMFAEAPKASEDACMRFAWEKQFVACPPSGIEYALSLVADQDMADDLIDAMNKLSGGVPSEDQLVAGRVYGQLELERALAWAVEELGELAQASRRKESPQRLAEELGQVTAWVYCLGNILGVDVARAFQTAVRTEARRQYTHYGALKPYSSSTHVEMQP